MPRDDIGTYRKLLRLAFQFHQNFIGDWSMSRDMGYGTPMWLIIDAYGIPWIQEEATNSLKARNVLII